MVQMLSGAVLLFFIGSTLRAGLTGQVPLGQVAFIFARNYRGVVVEYEMDDEFFAVWRTGVYEHRISEFHPVRGWGDVKPHDAFSAVLNSSWGLVPDGSDASDASDDELEL